MNRSIPVARLAALTEAAATLVSATDLESVLRRMVETAAEATGAKYAALGVVGAHKTLIEFVHTGIDKATVEMIGHLPEGRGVLGTLIREGNTIRLERIQDHPDSVGFPPGHPPMETFLGVPVGTKASAFGNLYLTEKEGGFSEDDGLIVEALASIAAAAVETTRLRQRLEDMAVVEDRQRIGRDLHDSIIQDLFGTGLHLQGLAAGSDDEELRVGLDDAVDRIDQTIEALRGIVAGLSRPGAGSFAELLRSRLIGLAGPYQVDLGVTVNPPDLDLDPEVVELLLPMISEATSNALRHSGTESIDVRVELLRDRIVTSVVDQGTGFDPGQVVSGMGLRNLRERAAGVGGDTEITSVPGVGTVIEVVIPYSEV